MGLAVSVGALADMNENDEEGAEWIRGQVRQVNAILQSNGLATFTEPESFTANNRCNLLSYPYSWVHYLRRAYVYNNAGQSVDAILGADAAAGDPLVLDETMMMTSHLLCHSDAEGFYVPVDFSEVIFDDSLPGAMLGSSHRLQAELAAVAPALGITLTGGELGDDEAARLNGTEPDAHNERELLTWFSHWEAARLSIEHSTMIVYQ